MKHSIIAALISLSFFDSATATTQIRDVLELDGISSPISENPLWPKVAMHWDDTEKGKLRFGIGRSCTANYRGYQSHWRVDNEKLTLVRVIDNPCASQPKEADLRAIADGKQAPLLASWFTGVIWVGRGEERRFALDGDEFGKYIVLVVQRGQVLSRTTVEGPKQ
jgi:hypothetical protein